MSKKVEIENGKRRKGKKITVGKFEKSIADLRFTMKRETIL